MHTLESHSRLLFLASEKTRNRRRLYLNNHLEKLLEGNFSPKSLFLVFRKDIESLGDALKDV